MQSDNIAQPMKSKGGAWEIASSGRKRWTAIKPSAPMGTLIRKIQCHENDSTNQPPIVGPRIGPTCPAIEMTASADTYASPVTLRNTASRPMGSSIEPPIPWITRATIS